jgi:hypothetical protein
MARIWAGAELEPGTAVIDFRVPFRDAIEDKYAQPVIAGRRRPYDAFFGCRYAIIEDPEGHCIGVMRRAGPELPKAPSL